MVENRLRWFGHVHRQPLGAPVRRVDQAVWNPLKRGRGRPKRTLNEVIEHNLSKDLIFDKTQWRCAIHHPCS